MSEKFSLKDHLFNAVKVAQLAAEIQHVYPMFNATAFQEDVISEFPKLELKARIAHIRQQLRTYLPPDYQTAVNIILQALPEPLDETRTDDDFGDFIYAPYSDFVAHYGCNAENLTFSLAALHAITQRFSAEYAIRFFLNAFPEETLNTLWTWTDDPHYHVRRLCSEGTRPKLPWGQKIGIAPRQALPLLHRLFADPTRFVTRSVANHLNDLSKTHPDEVLKILQQWADRAKQTPSEMAFIRKHALRTLIKAGHPQALALLGFGNATGLTLTDLQFNTSVRMDEALSFSFSITTQISKPLVLDYIVYFQSKQGTLSNKKTYKLQSVTLAEAETLHVQKTHLFRRNMTTRTLYAGEHRIAIQVNGRILGSFSFELFD